MAGESDFLMGYPRRPKNSVSAQNVFSLIMTHTPFLSFAVDQEISTVGAVLSCLRLHHGVWEAMR